MFIKIINEEMIFPNFIVLYIITVSLSKCG